MDSSAILDHFLFLDDPRNPNSVLFPLDELLVISFCAAICGITSYCGIAGFAEDKEQWLKRFLPMKHGIPSHDTFRRMFNLVDAKQFELAFMRWTRHAAELTNGAVVAIDGKTSRGSGREKKDIKPAHIVSAWASEVCLSLGHVKVDDKSNEITAIPELLDLLFIKGCIVTIDAIGCQKNIAESIAKKGADFALAVKENQPKLKATVEDSLTQSKEKEVKTVEKSGGREEIRRAKVISAPSEIASLGWPSVTHVGVIKSTRIVNQLASYEDRFYVLKNVSNANELLRVSRQHWGIENCLHWVLDVTMGDDACQVADKNGTRNLSTLRRIAINKMKKHQGSMSMRRCQSRAAMVDSFREEVLADS